MATYKTPNVYIEEISVFPPSVAEVETAIPAFIGYTEKATKTTANDLLFKPTKIFSLKEYEQYYGVPFADEVALTVANDAAAADGLAITAFTEPTLVYQLYFSLKMFFENGGGQCYIISVGNYAGTPAIDLGSATTPSGLLGGLAQLSLEDEPTLIVIPEATQLESAAYGQLATAVLLQCNTLGDRFAVFDILGGETELDVTEMEDARELYGNNYLKYAAAYYPFLKTSLNYHVKDEEDNVEVTYGATTGTLASFDAGGANANAAVYNFAKAELKRHYLTLPPSGAVVGVYAATDTNRGVWKAPANVSLNNVIEPVFKINNEKQASLNVDATSGKSINALRSFAGKGTLIWGARTLDGNSNEWRYISVRRFFNMVEESVKKSTYWAVFEPNDANTWVKVRGMIENYLTQKWRDGALAGATTKDAFFVRCGLGTTMTSQDILEGRMNVEIGMAVVRPAEFIILKFSHKLQTS